MKNSIKLMLPAAAMLLGLAARSASAAPAGTGLAPLKTLPVASSAVEKTYWVKKCHKVRRHGHWRVVCHRVWVKPHYRHRHH